MVQDDNPYAPPETDGFEVETGDDEQRAELRTVASKQKSLLTCLLLNIGLIAVQFAFPLQIRPLIGIVSLIVGLVGAYFVMTLAARFYGMFLAIILAVFSIIPLLGFLILFVVNSRATKLLQQHGIKVGFLGADVSRI